MIMHVRRVALMTLSRNVSRVRVPLHRASSSAPMTPQAAHSVAVASPRMSEKKTVRISRRQGKSFADWCSFSAKGSGGSRGGVGVEQRPHDDVAGVQRHHEGARQEPAEED